MLRLRANIKDVQRKRLTDTKARWQNGEITKIQFAETIGVSRGTLYRILGEEKDD